MKRALLLLSTLLLFAIATAAWADDVRMTPAAGNPAAAGTMTVDHDHNGNVELKIRVHHLAKPSALDPAKTAYVVWLLAKDRPADNAGELKVNNELNGEFRAITPYKDFDVVITAEDSPRVSQPGSIEVLRGSVHK